MKAAAAPNTVWARADDGLVVSGSRLVNRAFRKVPLLKMMPGKTPEPTLSGFSAKWSGRAMPIPGNGRRVRLMRKLEGLSPGVVVLPLYKKRCGGWRKGCEPYKN